MVIFRYLSLFCRQKFVQNRLFIKFGTVYVSLGKCPVKGSAKFNDTGSGFYSYRSASMGSRFAALSAGKKPKTTPIMALTEKAISTD